MAEGKYWTGTSWVTAEEMMRLRSKLKPVPRVPPKQPPKETDECPTPKKP